jgi:hypothetical protein
LIKSHKLVDAEYESEGLGYILIFATVAVIVTFFTWAWQAMQDLSKSSVGLATKALKSIGTRGSTFTPSENRSLKGDGVEMGSIERQEGKKKEGIKSYQHVDETNKIRKMGASSSTLSDVFDDKEDKNFRAQNPIWANK